MLDLVAVAEQLGAMRRALSSMTDELRPRVRAAIGGWEAAVALGPALRDRVRAARTSWLVADPLEPLGAYDVAGVDDYRVVATDGSQIYPDRHEFAHRYLVNVGRVDIDYRTAAVRLESLPTLYWLPDDVYPLVGGERQEADPRVVGARRFAAECDALTSALGPDTLAVTDGTLLLWWLEPEPDRLRGLDPADVKAQTFAALERLLERARDERADCAGYLSGPRSTDVVSMLKVVLCTEERVDCDRCPYDSGARSWTPRAPVTAGLPVLPQPQKPCEEADPISDAALFEHLLTPRQRSPRFRSAAKVAAAYPAPVDFVYLHTGAEIGRVEFPAWTTPEGLDRLCGCLVDQCDKGKGYPVALAEAHEQAVVRAGDRRAFLDLLRRYDVARPTAKLSRKRVSVL